MKEERGARVLSEGLDREMNGHNRRPTASGSDSRPVRKRAIALKYDADSGAAPLITAVGKGQVAEKIIAIAEDSGVARVEDEFQADALSAFETGSRVPKFLFDLVAEVLLFVEDADAQNQNRRYCRSP